MHSEGKESVMDISTVKDKAGSVIFLDIDGVLTNLEDGSSYLCEDPNSYRISKKNFKNLVSVLKEVPDSRVVISSNWRKFEGKNPCWRFNGRIYESQLPKLRKMLGDLVIGDLPHDHGLSKSEAMELWFEDNGWISKKHGKYVILDDDVTEGYHANQFFFKHLIYTSIKTGFTELGAKSAIKILK